MGIFHGDIQGIFINDIEGIFQEYRGNTPLEITEYRFELEENVNSTIRTNIDKL